MSTDGRDLPNGNTVPLSRTSGALVRANRAAEAALSLLVHHRDGVRVVPLPRGGAVVIGRDAPSDVVIPDRSLSRRHARFSLEAGGLQVEDLGSMNGTRLRGERVAHALLRPGDAVELGSVVVSPHLRSALEPEIGGVMGHDAFSAEVEAELARARYFGDPLAVVLIMPLASSEGEHVSRWWPRLREALRPVDAVGLYSPKAVEALLPRLSAEHAMERAAALVERAPRPLRLTAGLATFPGSATSAEELLEASRRAAAAATADDPVRQAEVVRTGARATSAPSGAIVASQGLRDVFAMVDRLARARLPVLLLGETGSGKEIVARAIHDAGPRATGPMISVNCGAIPAQLVESTLFGHQKGAFTGAVQSVAGAFRAASGGTLLLDEIGELSPSAQAALLRALETGRICPVGSANEVDVDVRVVAATHRDLEAMSAVGGFRRDLLYRLEAFTLVVPPLRKRIDDLEPLAKHFLEQAAASAGRSLEGIEPEALDLMKRYAWPGNVRELRNAIERAAVIAHGPRITVDDLPGRVRELVRAGAPAAPAPADRVERADAEILDGDGDLKSRVQRFEARLVAAALRKANGNQSEAARLLGVPVRTLSDKVKRLGLVQGGGDDDPGRT